MLFDVAKVLSAHDAQQLRIDAEALLLYRKGRLEARDKRPTEARVDLRHAEVLFTSVFNPMSALARCYAAIVLIDMNDAAAARNELTDVIAGERGRNHHGLMALALYHLALCNASDGDWDAALARAQESFSISSRLNERGAAGTSESLISDAYNFLGQTETAWEHGCHAIASLMASGDQVRARIVLAALSHAEIRRRRWDFAKSLVAAEQTLWTGEGTAQLDADMYLRRAVINYFLGDETEFARSLTQARIAAQTASDRLIQTKLVTDIAAVEGALIRSRSPARAVSLLSSAIAFQQTARRAALLPQLFLERGHAFQQMGRVREAENDFANGIAVLEKQRKRTSDPDLRWTIFDDAGELFPEAVAAAIRLNDPRAAFGYIERGRARTIADQLNTRGGPRPSLRAIMSTLPRNTLLVEYQMIADSLVIITVDSDSIDVARTQVSPHWLEKYAREFVSAIATRRPLYEVQPVAKQLFSIMLEPVRQRLCLHHQLVIIPDPRWQPIPFAALIDPMTDEFLVQSHCVVQSPSSVVYYLTTRRSPTALRRALVIANPSLQGGEFDHLPPLPQSEREGWRIATMYRSSAFIHGKDATIERFRELAPLSDVIYFSGHTVSAGMLFSGPGGRGILSASNLSRISLRRTRVAILASCTTAATSLNSMEGAPSIANAFLTAGVPSVIATLWDVDDGQVAAIVKGIHHRLTSGESPAEALREAQLEALRSGPEDGSNLSNWSVFVLIGGGSHSSRRKPTIPAL